MESNHDELLNLATLSHLFTNEDAARAFIESKVWPNGPVCPHCGHKEAYKLIPREGSTKPVRAGVYKCKHKDCRKQFTVRVGTIFEDSHIQFSKWLMTIHLMTSSKKGISSLQISRELGITVKSAWFMTHRIREAMKIPDDEPPLGGSGETVEADETYVGGKPRPGTGPHKRGRGTKKTPVAVLVERDGDVRVKPVKNVTRKTLCENIIVNVDPATKIVTDDFGVYVGIGTIFTGGHATVKHSEKVYVNIDGEHVNTAESFNALLKRGHYGIFHQLSKKHLHRYCSEFEFRWNRRGMTDGERMVSALKGVSGKRLMYGSPDKKAS
jgi:transposase-like protein